jgi:hypothetical protein
VNGFPDMAALRSAEALQVYGSDAAHQQIVQIGDKAKYYLLAASFIINVICIFTIAYCAFIYYQAKALDQNRYDWLQRDWVMPQQAKMDEHDKEIQALLNHQVEKR